ncbi:hypothetical protein V8C44DRAFT_335989 [Trichoderma aethiopicum]
MDSGRGQQRVHCEPEVLAHAQVEAVAHQVQQETRLSCLSHTRTKSLHRRGVAFPGRTDGAQFVCRFLTSRWTPSKAKLSTCRRWSRTKQMPMSLITYAHRCSKHLSQRFRRRLPSCAFRTEPYTGDRPPRHQKLLTAAMLASFDSLDMDSRRPRGPGRHYTSIVGEWCGKSRRLCRVHATVRAFVCNMVRSDTHKHLLVRGAGHLLGARTTCFT